MSNEASIHVSLQIDKNDDTGVVYHRTYPTDYNLDVDGALGPTPGAFTVDIYGTDVDLSALSSPGLCEIRNLDPDNFVTWGVRDPDTNLFYPIGKLPPASHFILCLSEYLGQVWTGTGTGTGTAGTSNKVLCLVADIADCNVYVGAFEA